LAVEARIEASRIFARKRTRELGEDQLKRARSVREADPRIAIAEAELLCDFDDRPAAVERYRFATMAGAPVDRLARAGLAHVSLLLGQFDEAHAQIQSLGALRSGEVRARRIRIRILQSQQRWADVTHAIDELLKALPGGDGADADRYDRACAMYRAGWFPHALAAFQELAASPGTGRMIDLARRTVKLLSRPDLANKRWSRLQAFPTVAQLRSHCGPASCELYLRYFGIPASQVEVARAIKMEQNGTAIYKMRAFLEQAGFHTRRIEAELPLLRRLVDAQIPVIMEEDYVITGHVAVAIGYDDVREVLDVQDPMSHDVRETPYEDLSELRDLSNHGALVAVPRTDLGRIAILDQIGAVDCRYMSLVDQAIAAKESGNPAEGDKLVAESIALRRDYEFAWFYKFGRAMDVLDAASAANAPTTNDARVEVHRIVSEVVAIWPDDAWPHRFRGEALGSDGRWKEAITAFERAKEKDPSDPRIFSWLGLCNMSLGEDNRAYECFQQALRRDPSNAMANGRLALLALEKGEIDRASTLNDVALRRAPKVELNHYVRARILAKRGDHAAAILSYDVALASGGKPATRLERAQSLVKLGRIDEAADFLEKAVAEIPSAKWLRVELAKLLHQHGRNARAETAARAALADNGKDAMALAVLGASLCARGSEAEAQEGASVLRRALAFQPTNAWAYSELGKYLRERKDFAGAIQAGAAAMGLARSDGRYELELGVTLSRAGYPAAAADHLVRGALNTEVTENDVVFVGKVLADAKRAARGFLDDLMAKRPDDLAVLRGYARTMLELFWGPQIAKPALDRLAKLAPDDPYAKAHRGSLAMDASIAKEQEGEQLLREAIAAIPEREFPRRALADRLQVRGRHDEVVAVLEPCGVFYQVMRMRIRSMLALDRFSDVDAQIAAFDKKWSTDGKPTYGAKVFRFDSLWRKADWAAALELTETLSRDDGERDDDGKLDAWETAKIECLIRLGEVDRALRFGERQAMDAPSLGRLSLIALDAGAPDLAKAFAERATRFDAQALVPVVVAGRLAELAGDTASAKRAYETAAKKDKGWFRPHVLLAKWALGSGDLQTARVAADAAVAAAHTAVEPFVARGQFLFASGQTAAAAQDLERAFRMSRPELRDRDHADGWAVRALILGDPVGASTWAAKYAATKVSPLDRARIQRLVPAR
jgi:tetratricopeptide (TPR) repeat protein